LLYQRVKPDGTLDAKDSYASDWIGTATEKPLKIDSAGRRVLGCAMQVGAIVDRFALVVDKVEE
jgi:hypothetical protein